MTDSTVEKYPLQWPAGYPRTQRPKSSRFGNVTFARARDVIFAQLKLLLSYQERATIVLSTNIPLRMDGLPYANLKQPSDKGIAVYFQYKGEAVVLCCDQWNKIEHNLWAVANTINAIRAIERWGVSDFLKRSFTGFQALPPPKPDAPKKEWWAVLNYQQAPGRAVWDWEGVSAQYKSLAKKYHPDAGGSVHQFQELSQAYDEAKRYFNR
jgi:hypothetical protein